MQVAVNIRLYEYGHEQVRIRKIDEIIMKFYWKWICKQKVKKGGVWSFRASGDCDCNWLVIAIGINYFSYDRVQIQYGQLSPITQ
jgi:hypothetical protein